MSYNFPIRKFANRPVDQCAKLARPKSDPDTPTIDTNREFKRKVLLSSTNKRKTDLSSGNRRRLKGKWQVKLVDDNQPLTSKEKGCSWFSLQSKTNGGYRKMIFMIKCTSWKEVISVIMDKGSCENMVSEDLVKKLGLRRYKVRTPYKMSWFKKGGEILVKHRCMVPIQLKDYNDKLWCDVVPMDACHILLGRLWQYDR